MSGDPSDEQRPRSVDAAAPAVSRYAWGFALAVVAAVLYSGANIALRQLADNKSFDWAIFVTACKGVVVSVVAWTIIVRGWIIGKSEFPPRKHWPTLLAGAVCTHLIGNLLIQYAFALGGIALVVPIVFSMIIVTGATLGWLVLGEPISPLLMVAVVVLISAIGLLGLGAKDAAQAAADSALVPVQSESTEPVKPASTLFVVMTAVLAGTGYGCVGVVVRRTRLDGVSTAGTLVLISSSGVFGLGAVSLYRLGFDGIAAIATWRDIGWIATASVCNAIAFFSIAEGYRYLPVVRVNLINSSQSAMCAIAGVFIFDEPATRWLIYGTIVTLIGLALVGYAKEKR